MEQGKQGKGSGSEVSPHTPPPSNQIIHVTVSKPITGMRTMDTVWVSGVMHAGKIDTEMGQAGYQLKAEVVVSYK
ncbi:MAG: DUF3299 domain-containing protein [Nitrosomonadaceae bacterium]|nr:DUF3299 domain-containing protein [Nitrosomonadaceae bacterium]